MKRFAGIVIVGLALLVGGCEDVSLFGDDDDAPVADVQPNTAQASQFCQNRGYQPGTDGFSRCLISVNENLRKNHGSMAAPGPYPQ